jgi:hypothetical protein
VFLQLLLVTCLGPIFISTAGFSSVLQSIAQRHLLPRRSLYNSWRDEWAADPTGAVTQDVRVDHRRRDVAVAQEFLDGPDVVSTFEQMRGKRVAGVTCHSFCRSRPPSICSCKSAVTTLGTIVVRSCFLGSLTVSCPREVDVCVTPNRCTVSVAGSVTLAKTVCTSSIVSTTG